MRRCAAHDHTVALKEARFNQVYPKRNGEPVVSGYLVVRVWYLWYTRRSLTIFKSLVCNVLVSS